MRNVSLEGLQSLLAEETGHAWVTAVSIHPHPDDPDQYAPSYFCANNENLVWGGHIFSACPLELTLASDTEDQPPQAKIKVDNVSQELVFAVRRTNFAPTLNLYILRVDPNGAVNCELGPNEFTLQTVTANINTVEAVLGYDYDVLNEPAVHHRFTPAVAPAIFANNIRSDRPS